MILFQGQKNEIFIWPTKDKTREFLYQNAVMENTVTQLSSELSQKYSAYNSDFEICKNGDDIDERCTPELLDACFTGCDLPYARHSMRTYTQEVEDDIKEIVRQSPMTVLCNFGTLRCRDRVTPLAAACANKNIPIHMIDFLLQNGADPSGAIIVNCRERSLIKDIEICQGKEPERYQQIKKSFITAGLLLE